MSSNTTDTELVRVLDRLDRRLSRMENKDRPGMVRGRDSSANFSDDDSSAEDTLKFIKKQRKILEDTTKVQTRWFKTMAEGIPIVGSLVKLRGRKTKDLENSMIGQTEAYKKAAKATHDYTNRMGVNSKELYMVQKTLAEVNKKSKLLQNITQRRQEIEKGILENSKKTIVEGRKLAVDLSNVPEAITRTEKALKKAEKKGKDEQVEKIKKVLDGLKELKELEAENPNKIFQELKRTLDRKDLQDAVKRDASLAAIMKPIMDDLGDDFEEAIEGLEKYVKKVDQTTKGSLETLINRVENDTKTIENSLDKLGDALSAIGSATAAGLVAAGKNEFDMILQRQRLTGSAFSTAMRLSAIDMGTAEVELLTSLAENRYTMRRLGQNEGFSGAASFLRSNEFDEMRMLARDLGYMGQETLDVVMRAADSLRRSGADSGIGAVTSTLDFIKDTFKDVGVTQDEMMKFTNDLIGDPGGLRLLSGRMGGSFANVDEMQKEIEMRAKLARVLNQELEVQQKRVDQLKSAQFGDVAAAFKRSIGVQLLGSQIDGVSSADLEILARQTRGETLTAEEQQTAEIALANLQIGTGMRIAEANRMGASGMGDRLVLDQFMAILGLFDGLQAGSAFAARSDMADPFIRSAAELESARVQTTEPGGDLKPPVDKLVGVMETIRGILKSSASVTLIGIKGAALKALGSLGEMIIAGAVGGGITSLLGRIFNRGRNPRTPGSPRTIPRPLRNMGRFLLRNAPRVIMRAGLPGMALGGGYLVGNAIQDHRQNNMTAERHFENAGAAHAMVRRMEEQGITQSIDGKSIDEYRADAIRYTEAYRAIAGDDALDPATQWMNPQQRYLQQLAPYERMTSDPSRGLGHSFLGNHSVMHPKFNRSETLASLMAHSRSDRLLPSAKKELRAAAEEGIINLIHAGDLDGIQDIGALKEMSEYLQEDETILREGEEDALAILLQKIDRLISASEEGNSMTARGQRAAQERFERMGEDAQRRDIENNIQARVESEVNNTRRRLAENLAIYGN